MSFAFSSIQIGTHGLTPTLQLCFMEFSTKRISSLSPDQCLFLDRWLPHYKYLVCFSKLLSVDTDLEGLLGYSIALAGLVLFKTSGGK
jgi:hypothetical protein